MGYYVDMDIAGVVIPAEKVGEALAAVNKLHEPELMLQQASGGTYQGGQVIDKFYSWVTNPPEGGFTSLVVALQCWRFDAVENPDGSVEIEGFRGQKAGDDEILFEAIAPFVTEGGEILVNGEDGEGWGYRFEEGALLIGRKVSQWVWG